MVGRDVHQRPGRHQACTGRWLLKIFFTTDVEIPSSAVTVGGSDGEGG